MRDTAVGQPAPPPTVTAPQDSEPRERPSERVSDVTIAGAVAQAVRAMPGVVDLSPGRVALAATYGSGQRVTGVVVHRLAEGELALEIHVILSEAYCAMAYSSAAPDSVGFDSEGHGVLINVASRIRSVSYDAMKDMPSLVIARADVFIDDLR